MEQAHAASPATGCGSVQRPLRWLWQRPRLTVRGGGGVASAGLDSCDACCSVPSPGCLRHGARSLPGVSLCASSFSSDHVEEPVTCVGAERPPRRPSATGTEGFQGVVREILSNQGLRQGVGWGARPPPKAI